MPKPVLDNDAIAKPRASVEKAIAELRAFTGAAGSAEMSAVNSALEYLGYAYSCLRPGNPAWSGS